MRCVESIILDYLLYSQRNLSNRPTGRNCVSQYQIYIGAFLYLSQSYSHTATSPLNTQIRYVYIYIYVYVQTFSGYYTAWLTTTLLLLRLLLLYGGAAKALAPT